jgi:uncharacterized peroxidase-related enzyme
MARLNIPASADAAPAASRARLEVIQRKLGTVPNLFRLVANSPATLEGYFSLSAALNKGRLPAQTGERIALAISEFNGCDYDLSAHTYISRNLAGLDDAEITANRNGASKDIEADAAVRFALEIARSRGRISAKQVEAVKRAGYDDAQIVEIVQHVALTIFTNYLNKVAGTEIDFPLVQTRRAA